ncbi:MAG TPA: globin [Gammaproteobacteria bacterium]|nr:globin [Gammaproteobacteria bacterium]
MNTELIAQHWDGIGDKELELVSAFYERLFERHPRFRELFPATMSHQAEKMVQTLALMAKHSEDEPVLHPHLEKVGARHRTYGLALSDFDDFLSVLMEVMGEYNPKAWSPQCEAAWREAFRQIVVPAMAPGVTEAG